MAMHRRDVVANVRDGAAAATPADRVGLVIARTAREDEAATARMVVGVMTDIWGVDKCELYLRREPQRVRRPEKQQGDYTSMSECELVILSTRVSPSAACSSPASGGIKYTWQSRSVAWALGEAGDFGRLFSLTCFP